MSRQQYSDLKIAIVQSRFNEPVTSKLAEGAKAALLQAGVKSENVFFTDVPGALEIPLAAKAYMKSGVDGVVVVGAVIRGETSHYDSVCEGVERGCSQLQLEYMKPIGFGVITTENAEQAYARSGGDKGNKGAEAAQVTLEMIDKINQIRS